MKRYVRSADTIDENELFGQDVDLRGYYSGHTDDLELMEIYAHDPANSVRVNLALNHNAPPELLRELAHDPCSEVRKYVVHNPNTPIDVVDSLWDDSSSGVRIDVALFTQNSEILMKMAKDPVAEIRCIVAENKHTPAFTLLALLADSEPMVQQVAWEARNKRR